MDQAPPSTPHWMVSPRLRLLAASATALFLELALIRVIDSTVQVMAYFNSFLILSSFLGLGAGSLLRRTRALLLAWPVMAVTLFSAAAIIDRATFSGESRDHVFWTLGDPAGGVPVWLVVPLIFALNTAFFIPLGSLIGSLFDEMRDRLRAYSWDIAGSLLGVVAFAAISFLQAPPWTWLLVATMTALVAVGFSSRLVTISVAGGLLACAALSLVPLPGRWSPYYKVGGWFLRDDEGRAYGASITVDKLRIQDALALDSRLTNTPHAPWRAYYELPYALIRPKSVLVLGGGSGNDAVIALQSGATRVDVVEIDPVILSMGLNQHPNRPYLDPRVRTINDDARAFLRRTADRYDLIVMNALDSHHQMPGLSTLRLESYIYTVEAFRDAARHMHEGSLLVVHLASTRPWMGERLYWSLAEAFGRPPELFWTPDSPFASIAFVQGDVESIGTPRPPVERPPAWVVEQMESVRATTTLATDDWPHLYLAERRVPLMYLGILALVLTASGVLVFSLGRPAGLESTVHFALLGAGFMLLETRSITKVALLFGSTWLVNALVIGFILACIFLANALVLRGKAPGVAACAVMLMASLVIGYVVSMDSLLDLPFAARMAIAGAWVALPILFASMLFSHSFARAASPSAAFGANLLGVVLGGALEYASMIVGLQALYLVALAVYVLALVSRRAWLAQPGS